VSGDAALLEAVEASVGIYGTAPTCHLSALARVDGYALSDLGQAVAEHRSLVRVRAMRYSAHLFPRGLLVEAVAATHAQARRRYPYQRKLVGDYEALGAAVEAALADGPLPSAGIRARIDPEQRLGPLFSVLLGMLTVDCRVVRGPTTGGWRSDRLTYARWSDWLPGVEPFEVDEAGARRRLAARYVAAYGPVTLEDLRWWAGWTAREARAADGLDLDVEGAALRLLGGVRLLPVWDVLLVAYRHRERLLDAEHMRFAYDASGNATSVVLDGGRVVGVWDLGRSDDPLAIRVAPLTRWAERRWDEVEAQAHRIAAMIGAREVTVTRVEEPVDLVAAPRNRHLSPLSD